MTTYAEYVYLHNRPCDKRRRAKEARKSDAARHANVINIMSHMHARVDIARKHRAFLIRNGRA